MIANSSYKSSSRHKNKLHFLCLLILFAAFCPAWAQTSGNTKPARNTTATQSRQIKRITPQIPKVDRYQRNKVFLEHADILEANSQNFEFQILRYNVVFRRGNMYLYCDSAHFYDKTNSIDAFGNVRMERGNNMTGYANNLHYDGITEMLNLMENVVIEKDGRVLSSDYIDYDVKANTGRYSNGGNLKDTDGKDLSSVLGTYDFNTDRAYFTENVVLVNNKDKYVMNTERLNYDTRTKVATILEETVIVSDSNKIYTNNGIYNTATERATLYNRSKLVAKDGKTLTGDTLYYDRKKSEGNARGDIIVTDPKHDLILDGDYGYHNEVTHVSYATKRARAREFSKNDTLYFHGDTLKTYVYFNGNDSVRVLMATNGVRFYRKDVQGLCGYLTFANNDSILNLYNHPVVWSGNRQIFSENEINVHLKDSTSIDWATIPNHGLLVEHLGEVYYNQLSGKSIKAYFEKVDTIENGKHRKGVDLRHVDVAGNVRTVFFPMEEDSTYNKCVRTESGYLALDLKAKQEVEKIKLWPEVTGTVIPLFTIKKSQLYLEKEFKWFDDLRPKNPDDIFNVSVEMRAMIDSPFIVQEKELERISLSAGSDGTGASSDEDMGEQSGEDNNLEMKGGVR